MGTPIAEEGRIIDAIKVFIRDGEVPTSCGLKKHFNGGQVARYQKILDDFYASKEGAAYVEQFARVEKLPNVLLEQMESHVHAIRAEMSGFFQAIVNYYAKEREYFQQKHHDETKKQKQAHEEYVAALIDENNASEAESERLSHFLEERDQKIVDLETELAKKAGIEEMMSKLISVNAKQYEANTATGIIGEPEH